MSKTEEQRSTARQKAEELLTLSKKKETERLAARERDSRLQDEKTARLRGLRLAKEAADRTNTVALVVRPIRKKADKTA